MGRSEGPPLTSDFGLPTGIHAILFDAGGTLIHIDGERVCAAAGVPWASGGFREAESAAVLGVREFIRSRPDSKDAERLSFYLDRMLVGLGLGEESPRREAARRVAAEHQRANLWSRAARGAVETLAELSERGYRLGVVSNADGRVRALLETAGVSGFLEFVVDSAEIGVEKPDARIFHAATEKLALPPSSCAYVGDIYEIDVEGARKAGLQPILIGDGPAPETVLRVADLPALLPIFPRFA